MDNYQAVFDAVRSRFSFNQNDLIQEISSRFDISWQVDALKQEFLNVAYEMQRPSITMKPKLYIDGNQWCCLYGDDIQTGICGFGESPHRAMESFDKAIYEKING